MNILERIVADTRDLVELSRRKVPLEELREGPFYGSPTLPLAPALRSEAMSFIAEIKKASPSKGILRFNYDVQSIAVGYKHGGARVLSVVTEPMYFHGALAHLSLVRQVVDLPLLRKDFIVDRYQLHEARAYGADAVLLIASVLDAVALQELHHEAIELGLGCLVEVYAASELERIELDRISVLGVNNRDLRTFEVNIEHSIGILGSVPDTIVKVSESGLGDPADIARLRESGIDAVLIGETFMRAPEPGRTLKALRADVDAQMSLRRVPLRRVV